MNEHRQKIEALLETFIGWGRESGNELGKDYHQGRSMAFYACADELEAILSDWPEEAVRYDNRADIGEECHVPGKGLGVCTDIKLDLRIPKPCNWYYVRLNTGEDIVTQAALNVEHA